MLNLNQKLKDAVFYGILDTGYVEPQNMYEKCKQLIAGGCGIIQLRAKKQSNLERAKMAEEILPLFSSPDAPIFIINDDVELAAKLPRAGLHIGQDDISPFKAREMLGEGKALGLSTHSPEQAKAANALAGVINYFAVGPIYATATKPGRIPVGLELVKFAAQMKPELAWFAIGGVNLKTAADVANAGAQRIVAVSDVLKPADTAAAVKALTREFLGAKARKD
ncbi:MAG: thiamine phosphate synthase [Opitutales bacterium]|nr:thiamine phosphate synthase [Opitutales bacterium]MBR6388946.1 thiamine phosphate synthase [Opitutales bacterium]